MLFITVYTYEPDQRDAILKRRAEGLFKPEGAKCLGQWSCASGGRAFTLCEAADPLTIFKWVHAWSDLGKFEVYPVVDTEELIKAFAGRT
jgi:hypothetical protein